MLHDESPSEEKRCCMMKVRYELAYLRFKCFLVQFLSSSQSAVETGKIRATAEF